MLNLQKKIRSLRMFRLFLAAAGLMLVPASTAVPAIHVPREAGEAELLDGISVDCSQPVDKEWIQKVNRIRWVAYSSPKPNSEEGFYQPTSEAIYQDLLALKKANFTGLITYGSAGIMGRQFLEIAQSLGYKGIIMGIWDPGNQAELSNARNASDLPIVLDRKSTRLNSSHANISYAVFCLQKKTVG